VRFSSTPSPRLQPSQCTVLHLGASSFVAYAAPADELVIVERFVNLVDLFWSEDLVVIFLLEDIFVMVA
jgi:hypothetical protein